MFAYLLAVLKVISTAFLIIFSLSCFSAFTVSKSALSLMFMFTIGEKMISIQFIVGRRKLYFKYPKNKWNSRGNNVP